MVDADERAHTAVRVTETWDCADMAAGVPQMSRLDVSCRNDRRRQNSAVALATAVQLGDVGRRNAFTD